MEPFIPKTIQPPEEVAQIDAFRGEDLGREPEAPILSPIEMLSQMEDIDPAWYRLRISVWSRKGVPTEREGDYFTTPREISSLHREQKAKVLGWAKHWPQPAFKPIHTNLYF